MKKVLYRVGIELSTLSIKISLYSFKLDSNIHNYIQQNEKIISGKNIFFFSSICLLVDLSRGLLCGEQRVSQETSGSEC